MNEYIGRVLEDLRRRYAHEPEYLQSVTAWLDMIAPAAEDPGMRSWISSPAWWSRSGCSPS